MATKVERRSSRPVGLNEQGRTGLKNRCKGSARGRVFLVGAALLLGLPLCLILLFRFVNPPVTSFMAVRYLEGLLGVENRSELRYRWVDWEEIPSSAALAVIAAEDQKFPDHWGFDFQSIADAIEEGQAGGRYRGASTITQQVAKNLFLWNGRSFIRKGMEAYLTVLLEALWSKRRILEVYLNVVEFGDGIYGVRAASETFFGKPPVRLTRGESALLAAVLPNPRKYLVQAPSRYVNRRVKNIQKQMENLGSAYTRRVDD